MSLGAKSLAKTEKSIRNVFEKIFKFLDADAAA
jgi:hypothetical protein